MVVTHVVGNCVGFNPSDVFILVVSGWLMRMLNQETMFHIWGYASGDGCNCLIDTLKQQLQLDVDVSLVRSELEKIYVSGPGAVIGLGFHTNQFKCSIQRMGNGLVNGGLLATWR
eukprot:1521315-Karenia_brevis.AAC.1